MANDPMEVLANEFVNLPIIITDYDAIFTAPSTPATATSSTYSEAHSGPDDSAPASSACSTTSSPIHQNAKTGFTDFADELWNRMTFGMKQKLREACVEVLRRTDDPSEEEKVGLGWGYDEDARFLD
ncbi:hypothetical protein LTR85_008272 [Meristemomyces frigidus]|nr:hypothetical protein LTR85_008272 [Meristemomyces frigidus]